MNKQLLFIITVLNHVLAVDVARMIMMTSVRPCTFTSRCRVLVIPAVVVVNVRLKDCCTSTVHARYSVVGTSL